MTTPITTEKPHDWAVFTERWSNSVPVYTSDRTTYPTRNEATRCATELLASCRGNKAMRAYVVRLERRTTDGEWVPVKIRWATRQRLTEEP